MPTLAQSHLIGDQQLTPKNTRPIEPPARTPPPQLPYWLQKSPFASTPIPPLKVGSDSTRNFYTEGVPQYRILPAQS